MTIVKINCKYIKNVAWCSNKKIKRSLFGIGARCCSEYPPFNKKCGLKVPCMKKPIAPPASMIKK